MLAWGAALLLLTAFAPAGRVSTDLAPLLSEPPSSDWIDIGPAYGFIAGEFDADAYGAYVDSVNGTPGNTAANLRREGFVGGYARNWQQRGSQDELNERVFEFAQGSGANDFYSTARASAETSSQRRGDIPAATSIPNAFGVILAYQTGSGRQWRVDFLKGNLVFVVHANAPTSGDDLTDLAVGQAKLEYTGAPASTHPSAPSSTGSQSSVPGWILWAIAGTSVFVVLLIAGIVVAVILLTRRPRPLMSQRVTMSPDGYYWWDGTKWRLAASDPPPR